LRRLRRIINAPATKARAFAPVAGSISGTDAKQLPATPIPIRAIPATFMMVLLNIVPPQILKLSFDYQDQSKDCQCKKTVGFTKTERLGLKRSKQLEDGVWRVVSDMFLRRLGRK
jgi:hypothetical protein